MPLWFGVLFRIELRFGLGAGKGKEELQYLDEGWDLGLLCWLP